MAQANFTDKEVRLLLGLYANTDHGRFASMREEADFYANIIGRPVSDSTVGRLKAGKWYTVNPSGEIVKSPTWDNVKKPRPEQATLFPGEAAETARDARKEAAEVLAAMLEHLEALDVLQRELHEIIMEAE